MTPFRTMLLSSVSPCPLPRGAALAAYAIGGAYTDCYCVVLPRVVTQTEYVEAFYTSAVFKVERWLIATFLSRPSTDAQAQLLAQGSLGSFAAWSVEQRQVDQLLLAAGRTRSWLMACPSHESASPGTTLYFGSAVVPRRGAGGTDPAMGWQFRALLGFHKLYSRVLLGAARRTLAIHA
jgi:hypothetical protein